MRFFEVMERPDDSTLIAGYQPDGQTHIVLVGAEGYKVLESDELKDFKLKNISVKKFTKIRKEG